LSGKSEGKGLFEKLGIKMGDNIVTDLINALLGNSLVRSLLCCAGRLQGRNQSDRLQGEKGTESKIIPIITVKIKNGPFQGHNISVKKGNGIVRKDNTF
jgi:hypothetical protein